jgi:hypothetical protein
MDFLIEMEPYERLDVRDPEDSTTSEAIESVYRAGPAVRIHMAPQTWATLPVEGGVSDIYSDLVRMLKNLEMGVYPFEITFLCSCFTAIWRFSDSNGVLTIRTSWTAVNGVSNGREIRHANFNDEVSQFVVEKETFVAEWRNLLGQIKCELLSAGYDSSLDNFEYLEQLASEP